MWEVEARFGERGEGKSKQRTSKSHPGGFEQEHAGKHGDCLPELSLEGHPSPERGPLAACAQVSGLPWAEAESRVLELSLSVNPPRHCSCGWRQRPKRYDTERSAVSGPALRADPMRSSPHSQAWQVLTKRHSVTHVMLLWGASVPPPIFETCERFCWHLPILAFSLPFPFPPLHIPPNKNNVVRDGNRKQMWSDLEDVFQVQRIVT